MVQYKYDAWGNHKVLDGSGNVIPENYVTEYCQPHIGHKNPFRYRGYFYDKTTGLYFLNSRFYDPETGRFLNADTVDPETIGGLNLYAYCGNNPVMYSDPSGHFIISAFLISLAVSTIIGAVDGGITALINGENFWKGFFAGAISGAIGGFISYFSAGLGNVFARGISSLTYSILNEFFQTGGFDASNLVTYVSDSIMDMAYSSIYIGSFIGMENVFLGSILNGFVDSGIDIAQTFIIFSPIAQKTIRGIYNDIVDFLYAVRNRKPPIFEN